MNARGKYGWASLSGTRPRGLSPAHGRGLSPRHGIYVGQGFVFGHTRGDVDNELDQSHGEMMAFGQEAEAQRVPVETQASKSVQNTKARENKLVAWKDVDAYKDIVAEVPRISRLLSEVGVDRKTFSMRFHSEAPYTEGLKQPFITVVTVFRKSARPRRIAPRLQKTADLSVARSPLVKQYAELVCGKRKAL